MTISLTEEIIQKVIKYSQELYHYSQRALLKFWKLISLLSPTALAVIPARIQYKYLQEWQISILNLQNSYPRQVNLHKLAKTELLWWIENLRVLNGKRLRLQEPHLLNQANASTEDRGAHCSGILTGGIWLSEEPVLHINSLEL